MVMRELPSIAVPIPKERDHMNTISLVRVYVPVKREGVIAGWEQLGGHGSGACPQLRLVHCPVIRVI